MRLASMWCDLLSSVAQNSQLASIVEFDCLGRKPKSKMGAGAGFPEQFISIFCVNHAALARQEKSLATAGIHQFEEAAANMRR